MANILVFALSILPLLAHAGAPYCIPGQHCFPSQIILTRFNASINGRLLAPRPYADICYGQTFNNAACSNLVANQGNEDFRASLPAALMYTQNELLPNGTGCTTPATAPTEPLTGDCELGALASFVVDAATTEHISLAVKFAAKYNLRLRMKCSGHDYFGRSTAPGAFTIWTHNLNSTEFLENFQPSGCNSSYSVISVEAGVPDLALYAAGAASNTVGVGGFDPTVCAAGGWGIGGGAAGPWAPQFGMGVDNIVQFDVINAAGQMETANACTNTDLFWALLGGGGAFGVVTKAYFKAHPAYTAVNVVAGTLTANSTETYGNLIQIFLDSHPMFQEQNFTWLWETSPPTVAMSFNIGFLDSAIAPSADETFALFQNLTAIPGVTSQLTAIQFPNWNEAYVNVVEPITNTGNVVGVNIGLTSRVVSQEQMLSQDGRDKITDFIIGLPSGIPFIFQKVGGGAVLEVATDATAVNPAFRSSFGYIDVPIFGSTPGYTATQNGTVDSILAQEDEVFGTAAYYNENTVRQLNWQEAYWGSNYPRLFKIKSVVDPEGVFSCVQCVGSENGW